MPQPGRLVRPYFKRDMWGKYIVWPDPRAIAFGNQLRRARRQAGMSQQKVADRAGVSQSVISRLERGLAPGVTTERLINICDAMGTMMPFGFCPHSGPDHRCPWPRIVPENYEHPPVMPRVIGLPIVDELLGRRRRPR